MRNHALLHIDEMMKRVNGYDVNNLKCNDREGRAYRFAQIFIEALEFHD